MEQAVTSAGFGGNIDLAIAAWVDAKTNHSQSVKTRKAYAATVSLFRATVQHIGLDLDSESVKVSLLAQKFAAFSSQGKEVRPATFNQRLAILSSFYEYARQHRFLAENPIDLVDRAKVQPYAGVRSLDPRFVTQQMKQIDRTTLLGARDYALLGVLLQTGRRLSEVAALQWRHVLINDQHVILTFDQCKGGKVMMDKLPVPLSKALLAWIHLYHGSDLGSLDSHAPLWVNFARNRYHGQTLGIQSIADICEKRLGESRVHVTRHTYAHGMVRAGADVTQIQAHLGHESLATTGRYVAMLQSAENQHADALAAMFGINE